MRWFLMLVVFGLFRICCEGENSEAFALGKYGEIRTGNVVMKWRFFAPGWKRVPLNDGTFQAESGSAETGRRAGIWTIRGEGIRLESSLAKLGTSRFRFVSHLEAEKQFPPTQVIAFSLTLPDSIRTLILDGKEYSLPRTNEKTLLKVASVRTLAFETEEGTVRLSGALKILIQDNRQWTPNFEIRISPVHKDAKRAEIALELEQLPVRSETLDLRSVANRAFADEAAGDGKGGWTDQGPTNDLRALRPGRRRFFGISFDLIDPAKNQGRSCLVLSGKQRNLPSEARIFPRQTEKMPCLYLLHASAWTPKKGEEIGRIRVKYPDGAGESFPVLAGRDCGNWWLSEPFPNAGIAWRKENPESFIGLYLSVFPLKERALEISFEAGDCVWMICGASVGDRQISFSELSFPVVMRADRNWFPVEFSRDTIPGSLLDFSGLLDAPAGKFGPVLADRNGHFSFRDAPGKRIRFLGVNLCMTANYLDRKTADDLVEKLARNGYNALRLHHFENLLLEEDAPDSLTFSAEALDKFFYLISAAKRKGIYLTLDLYCSRRLREGDGIREVRNLDGVVMKALLPVSRSAMENWKRFVARLLLEKNPYTGLPLAEEPALFLVSLVNEGGTILVWDKFPEVRKLYLKRYEAYLRERGMDTPENRKKRTGPFLEFLVDLQMKCVAEQKAYLRTVVKTGLLVTDMNWYVCYPFSGARNLLDAVDNHAYWDHPHSMPGNWKMPFSFTQASAVRRFAHVPRFVMPSRIFGKPFLVTEWNFCQPNRFRTEAAPLMGGYAALQDWDGLFRFAWSHNRNSIEKPFFSGGFDIASDPQAQLADRIVHALFLRGDVSAANEGIALEFRSDHLRLQKNPKGDIPSTFSMLGLQTRIGTLCEDALFPRVRKINLFEKGEMNLPSDLASQAARILKTGRSVSSTGELLLDSKNGQFQVVTPCSEVLSFSDRTSGKLLEASGADSPQTVALISLDGRPLSASRKMVLFHLTDLANTGERFGNQNRTVLQKWGSLPLLLRRGVLSVRIHIPGLRVEALKLDGSCNGSVPVSARKDGISFRADNASRPGGVMAYLLTR